MYLFRNVTITTFNTSNKPDDMDKFHLRMQLAALRQLLRDNEGRMSQEKIDEILDLIGKILRELEKE